MKRIRKLGVYRTLPEKDDHPIGDRYATRHGLLKRYSDRNWNRYTRVFVPGHFSRRLQYPPAFENKTVQVFRERFPQAARADAQAFRNYLRAYVGTWDFSLMYDYIGAMVRAKAYFSEPLNPTEKQYLAAIAKDELPDGVQIAGTLADARKRVEQEPNSVWAAGLLEAVQQNNDPEISSDDYLSLVEALNAEKTDALLGLIQGDAFYAVPTKLIVSAMASAPDDIIAEQDVKRREMRHFIRGYLVPRMFGQQFTGQELAYWQEFLRASVRG